MKQRNAQGVGGQRRRYRLLVAGLGLVAVISLAHFFPSVQANPAVAAHLFYLPVILACMWFGWKGLGATALGASILVVVRLGGYGAGYALGFDLLQALVLLAVGAVVAFLSERHAGARSTGEVLSNLDASAETRAKAATDTVERQGTGEGEVLDALVEHVIYQDRDLRILWANKAACESAGVGREELEGRHCYEVWAQRTAVCPDCPVVQAMETGRPQELEKTTPDGRTWLLRGRPILDHDGNVVGGAELTLDITRHRAAEESLRESERRLSLIYNTTTDLMLLSRVEANGRFTIISANSACMELTHGMGAIRATENGCDIDLEWLFVDVFGLDDEQVHERIGYYENVVATGLPARFETVLQRGKDETVIHENTLNPVFDDKGHCTHVLSVARDITESRRAEEAYRALVEQSLQGLVVLQDRQVVFANRAMARISGHSIDEMLAASARQMRHFVHAEDRRQVWRYLRAQSRGPSSDEPCVFRAARKDGTQRWLQVHISRVIFRARPALQAACCDVTDRKEAEEALRRSEARNHALVDAVPDFMFRISDHGVFLEYKPAKEGQTFVSPEAFLNKHIADVFPEPLAQESMQCIKRALDTRTVQVLEYTLPGPNDTLCEYEARIVACGGSEVVAIVRDITERKRSERLARITRDLAFKLSGASDLRKGARLSLNAAIAVSEMDCGGIYLLDEVSKDLTLLVSSGISEEFARSVSHYDGNSPRVRLVMQNTPVYHRPGKLRIRLGPAQRQEGLRAMAIVPMLYNGSAIGCLLVASHTAEEVPAWSRMALETVTAQVGSTIRRLDAEELLRETVREKATILDAMSEVVTYQDTAFKIVWANRAAGQALGMAPEQAVGRICYELWHGRSEPCEDCPTVNVLKTGCSVEHEMVNPKGDTWLLRSEPVKDAEGRVVGVVELAHDITERKRAEEALRDSEMKYRQLYEASRDGSVVVDTDGRVLECNAVFLAMVGYTIDELRRMTYEEITPSKWHDMERRIIDEQVLVHGYSEVYEKEYVRKDGSVFAVEIRAYLNRDEDGRAVGTWALVRDITERKEAEVALRTSERNYREIFDATNDAIFVHDAETGALLDCNETTSTVFGYGRQEMLGCGSSDGWTVGDPPYGHENVREFICNSSQGGPNHFEWILRRKNGEPFWAEVNLRHAIIGGHWRVLAVVRDITERKEAEKQGQQHLAELTRAWHANTLGEMASGLAHELNQPLCAILNYSSGCLRLTDKEHLQIGTLRSSIEQISGQAERAAGIIKRIRSLVAKRDPQRARLRINDLVNEVLRMIQKETVKSGVQVVCQLADDLPAIKGDGIEIEQVVLNLMRNAVEAMGGEDVTERTLTVATSLSGADALEVAVTDTGHGISAELAERIFESFFTTKNQGLGIGLSLSRRIVEAHGGRLWAESKERSGTTFRFTLPIEGVGYGQRRSRSLCRR